MAGTRKALGRIRRTVTGSDEKIKTMTPNKALHDDLGVVEGAI